MDVTCGLFELGMVNNKNLNLVRGVRGDHAGEGRTYGTSGLRTAVTWCG